MMMIIWYDVWVLSMGRKEVFYYEYYEKRWSLAVNKKLNITYTEIHTKNDGFYPKKTIIIL